MPQYLLVFGGQPHHPKGGVHMPLTITWHWRGFTITIKVKRDNRHPGR